MLAVNQAIIQLSVHFESWMIAIMTWLNVTEIMTWLTVTDYLYYRWLLMCSVYHRLPVLQMTTDVFRLSQSNPVLMCSVYHSRLMPFHRSLLIIEYDLNMSTMMGATNQAGIVFSFRSNWVHLNLRWISSCLVLSFLCSVLWIIVCLLVFCPLALVYCLAFYRWPLLVSLAFLICVVIFTFNNYLFDKMCCQVYSLCSNINDFTGGEPGVVRWLVGRYSSIEKDESSAK
jgi:hypothetical protein